ncbi:SH22A protein, partial [Fregata magnificens]|nr:SH22A protein [Fregata magnificens]
LGTGDPMGDDRPLFSTFKPIGEDNPASAKPGPNTTPVQPQRAEQPPGHHNTDGRVGRGVAEGPSPAAHHPSWCLSERDPRPDLVALRAQTRLWFEQTQARRLGAKGELPAWFHGFISRRETEQLLQDQPLGCFLVRFSESTVGFVLSYRGRDRCRHFVLDQLPDGRYVILGERSAHAELADLLRHYATAPVTPYREFLTVPCGRADEPQGGTRTPAGSDAARSSSSEAPANLLAYSAVSKGTPGARQAAAAPPLPAEPSTKGGSSREVHKEAVPSEPPMPPQPADAKYQQLMCFHTYAEPHEGFAPSPSTVYELQEPIPFYAMGWGSSPSAGPKENIYSEV